MSFNWHRAFGLLLTDEFTGTPFEVEIEKDISVKNQLLDVVVIRRRPGDLTQPLPDGLAPLTDHNLITFKSMHEALDAWTLDELLGYYVGYRKAVSPSSNRLQPTELFRLIAVATRFPESLTRQFTLQPVQSGVYDCQWGSKTVRLIVVRELPREPQNAGLALFSADPTQVVFGSKEYRLKQPEMSSLLTNLIGAYYVEGSIMPYGFKEFMEEFRRDFIDSLSPEELNRFFPLEKRLEGIPPEKRLEGIPLEMRIQGVSPEKRLEGIPPEQILKNIPVHLIQQYLDSLKSNQTGEETPPSN